MYAQIQIILLGQAFWSVFSGKKLLILQNTQGVLHFREEGKGGII